MKLRRILILALVIMFASVMMFGCDTENGEENDNGNGNGTNNDNNVAQQTYVTDVNFLDMGLGDWEGVQTMVEASGGTNGEPLEISELESQNSAWLDLRDNPITLKYEYFDYIEITSDVSSSYIVWLVSNMENDHRFTFGDMHQLGGLGFMDATIVPLLREGANAEAGNRGLVTMSMSDIDIEWTEGKDYVIHGVLVQSMGAGMTRTVTEFTLTAPDGAMYR